MIEKLMVILILFPFAVAILLSVIKNDKVRARVVYIGGSIIGLLSIAMAFFWFRTGGTLMFHVPYTDTIEKVILAADLILMVLIVWLCIRRKKLLIALLSVLQTGMVVYSELFGPELVKSAQLRMDWLTFIMIMIIGIIGVFIGIYAVGYMRGYHIEHKQFKDRRRFFFTIVFVFYGAMFGLVMTMDIVWLDLFWEITSLCSFLLIGYTKTDEAVTNSFRALWMNLLGGVGFAVAIVYSVFVLHTSNLYDVIQAGMTWKTNPAFLIPIAMLAFAALTKSALFPFSKWLLGAMVAPTPSSALLHSATMVKAGVYLLLRLSVAMHGNNVGIMVYLVGGFTFFAASLLAISQSDGKKVLAYSTISNLGLIAACAGIGMGETIWAAVFLIIYHAVSKSTLFQCVGAIENTTGSRNIEDMQGLAMRYPRLGFILLVGIAGMFLAPFGMLVSKWAALKAFIDAPSPLMVLFIVFGSSSTMFYWTKWMAKILGSNQGREHDITQRNEYASMFFHAGMIIALCMLFPVVSDKIVEPLVSNMFGQTVQVLSEGNIILTVMMVAAVFIVPLINYLMTKGMKKKDVIAYMGGANAGDNTHFVDYEGEDKKLQVSNWYMDNWFGEKKLFGPSVIIGILIIVIMMCLIIGGSV